MGTSVGTITEPDCLGPCEPGTSVTLEGIVWHETEGGKTNSFFVKKMFINIQIILFQISCKKSVIIIKKLIFNLF